MMQETDYAEKHPLVLVALDMLNPIKFISDSASFVWASLFFPVNGAFFAQTCRHLTNQHQSAATLLVSVQAR